jgi:succinate dehydrogenase / fumarate reductase cytochrome b subunit
MSASIDHSHFLLRRLHSLLGLLPVGGFLIFHLWENSQSRFGALHYNDKVVGFLQGLNYLLLMEIFVIALPILFHAGYGLVIMTSGRWEPIRYPWLHNWMYLFQRVSGVIILLFLLFHVGSTRVWGIFQPHIRENLYAHMQGLLSDPLIFMAYALGMLISGLHLCNGLWTMAIVWGVTTTPRAQILWFRVCMMLAVVLSALGLHGLWGFVR